MTDVLDEGHGGVAPELEHDCPVLESAVDEPCPVLGVLCPNWLALEAGEWPGRDDPPDPL